MEMTKKNDNLLEIAHAERFDQVSHQYVSDLNKNLSLTGSDSAYFYQAKINIIKKKLRSPFFHCFVDSYLILSKFEENLAHNYYYHHHYIAEDPVS